MDPRDREEDSRDPTDPSVEEQEERPGIDALLRVLVDETTLWPLLIVLFASGGAFGAALLVLAGVDRNPFAALALLLVLGMTLDIAWRARSRPGLRLVARGIGMLWITAAAMATLAWWFGIV